MADYKRVTVDAIFAALRHAETRPNVPHSHLVRLDSHAELIKRAIADLGVLAVIQPASPAAPLYLFDGHDLATIFKEVKSLCSVDSNNSNVAGHQSSTSSDPTHSNPESPVCPAPDQFQRLLFTVALIRLEHSIALPVGENMFTDTTFLQNYVRSPHRSGILHQLSHVILRYWEELELAKQKAIIAELEQLRVRITYDYANANRLAAVALEIKHGAPGYP
ncbi:hypothetical protein JCM16303_000786 [Sporobolomyces ruberrimus]